MTNKKITMKDIAELAGVGRTTVSRFFNGGYVKEETRKRIQEIVDEYNFKPNTFAQSLQAKESKIIGVIVPSLTSRTAARMLTGLDEYLKENGYTLLIMNTNYHVEEELEAIEKLRYMNVDGIILSATHLTKEHENLIRHLDVPLVILFQNMKNTVRILNDDFLAGYKIGQFVARRNHKDVLYLGVEENDEAVGRIRRDGVIRGLKDNGVENIETVMTHFTFAKTRAVVKEILKREKLPSIIICATDNIAMAALKELREANIKVPQEVSLTGFGGYESSQLLTPSLCTIRFDVEEAGRKAGETLIKMIKDEPVHHETVLGFAFIEGKSVTKRKKSKVTFPVV